MSLSVDAIRREIGERRDRLARLHRSADGYKHRIEEAERVLAEARTALESHQALIVHEDRAVEALQAAVAVLSERLPGPVPDVAELIAEPEPPSVASHPHTGPRGGRPGRTVASPRWVIDRAEELDIDSVSPIIRERAEYVVMVLGERAEPMRQVEVAEVLAELMDCPRITAQGIVSDCMPYLFRQGRVRPVDPSAAMTPWELTPPERASGRLGVDVDNFSGKTTSWPVQSEQPKGQNVRIETQPFEGGKRR
jgi:hypothetical protein